MSTAALLRPRFLAVALLLLATVASAAPATGQTVQRSALTAIRPCSAAQLTIWIGLPPSGAAGGAYYELEFSDVSRTACTLTGFPGVSAVTATGRRLGRPAAHDPFFRARPVVLRRGVTAHAVLRITDVAVFSPSTCRPVTAAGLRVYAPGTTRSTVVPLAFRACSRRGPIFLHVRVVRAGTGIPNYSL